MSETAQADHVNDAVKLVEDMLSFIEKTSRRAIRFSSIVDLKTGKLENPQDRLVAHVDKALTAAYQRGLRANVRMRVLEQAGLAIHSEYCGQKCHAECIAVTNELTRLTEGGV